MMLGFTNYGDSVYVPGGTTAPRRFDLADPRGPLGRWVRRDESDYEEALEVQRTLEESWVKARDELGDG